MKSIYFQTESGSSYTVKETGRFTGDGRSIAILEKNNSDLWYEVIFSNIAIKGMSYVCELTESPVNLGNAGGKFSSSAVTYVRVAENHLTPEQQRIRDRINSELNIFDTRNNDDGAMELEFKRDRKRRDDFGLDL